jgi:hypothetical protein
MLENYDEIFLDNNPIRFILMPDCRALRGRQMAKPPEAIPQSEWIDDGPEMESSMEMDDEELEFEEFDGEETAIEVKGGKAAAPERDYVPLWRLIEMSRENRSLRMELADFEDYEDYDGGDGGYAGGLSH